MNEIIKNLVPQPIGLPERHEEFRLAVIKALNEDEDKLYEFYLATRINLKQNINVKGAIEAEAIHEYTKQFTSWYATNYWNKQNANQKI